MGCDTYAKILGKVTQEEIVKTIKEVLEVEDVVSEVKRTVYNPLDDLDFPFRNYGDEDYWYTESGFICFTYECEKRMIFYCYDNINTYENLEYYKAKYPDRPDILKMIKSEKTHLGLGYWGKSVEILEAIVKKFGGWLDENDCDGIPYRRVEKV